MKYSITRQETLPQGLTESYFEQLFKTYYKELLVYAITLVDGRETAEEIVQQVFYKLWEKRQDIAFGSSEKAYLYKAVYNSGLNYIKHQQVKQQHVKHVAQQGEPFQDDGGGKILQKELSGHIKSAIDELPQQCRAIFLLSRMEELSYREIAERLTISVKTVEAQMGKALRMMRERLADYLLAGLTVLSTCIFF